MGASGETIKVAKNAFRQRMWHVNHGKAKVQLDLEKTFWFNRHGYSLEQSVEILEYLKRINFKYFFQDLDYTLDQLAFANQEIYPTAMPATYAWQLLGAPIEVIRERHPSLLELPITEHYMSGVVHWFRAKLVYIEEVKELYYEGVRYENGTWNRQGSFSEVRLEPPTGY